MRRGFFVFLILQFSSGWSADRVITLSPHLAELVCAAGGCNRLVGVGAYSDYPPQVRQLPRVGDAFVVNAERVLSLNPDLVLAWQGGTPPDNIRRLEALKLRVEWVSVRRLEDVAAALQTLGRWLGTEAVARSVAQDYLARLQDLRKKYREAAPLRVLYQIETSPLYSINRDSPISQAIELCGGVNVFADLPTLAAPVHRESVLVRDPQVIVFAKQDDTAAIRDLWKRSPPISASRADALYAVDGDLLGRASPRLLQGVEELCEVLNDARSRASSIRSAP